MAKNKLSAGILLYRLKPIPQVLLVHPGGPFWAKKDEGAWSLPKGEYHDGENALDAARREFAEETGMPVEGNFVPLGPLKQKSGKIISAWAVEGDLDLINFRSNTFEMEWPPRSGKVRVFPEVDRAEWFTEPEARVKIIAGQLPFIEEIFTFMGGDNLKIS